MKYPYWDLPTFVFYYLIGIVCAILIGIRYGNLSIKNSRIGIITNTNEWYGYYLLIIILILFATLRKVAPGLGGTDSVRYESFFINSHNDLGRFSSSDILYGYYIYYLRSITSSPIIFRLVSYSIIAFNFIYFIKEICPYKVSMVPFILIVWPYICGFSSMRNTMAIGFLLLALVQYYKHRYVWGFALFILACLLHRMTFVFLPLFILYKPLFRAISNSNKLKLFLIITGSIIIATYIARVLQNYIILFGILDNSETADGSYITKNAEYNVLRSWPMYIQQVILMLFFFVNFKTYSSNKVKFVVFLSCIDAIITLPSLILGMWRISQYLYLPTLILWGKLIYDFNLRFKKSYRPIISLIFLLGFTFILYKRLDAVYESSSLMPYLFIWE